MEPLIRRWVIYNLEELGSDQDADRLVRMIKEELATFQHTVFINLPGILDCYPTYKSGGQRTPFPWDPETERLFKLTFPHLKSHENYLALPINGTTFSGLCQSTTFGNTLRTLAYAYYYLD